MKQYKLHFVALACASLLTACGGGSDNNGNTEVITPMPKPTPVASPWCNAASASCDIPLDANAPTLTFSGVAATGLAVPQASVTAHCASSGGSGFAEVIGSTGMDGKYTVTLPEKVSLPCMVRVNGTASSPEMYALIETGMPGDSVNVNPLTTLQVAVASGLNPAVYFQQFKGGNLSTTPGQKMAEAQQALVDVFRSIVDLSTVPNFVTSPLVAKIPASGSSAGQSGNAYDQLLDAANAYLSQNGRTYAMLQDDLLRYLATTGATVAGSGNAVGGTFWNGSTPTNPGTPQPPAPTTPTAPGGGTGTGTGTTQTAQTITFTSPGDLAVNATATLAPTASSGLAVFVSSTTPSVCSVSGATLKMLAAGTCSLTARQNGNATYAAATPVTLTINGTRAAQTITFANPGAKLMTDTPVALTATASSGLAVSFSSATTSICTVTGANVTLLGAGNCSIDANQAGNGAFAAAPAVSQTFAVSKVSQNITIGDLPATPALKVRDVAVAVTATASSNLAVALSSSTPSICTISGGNITPLAAGTCTITGDQAGNATYNAATQVTKNFTVAKGDQQISSSPATGFTLTVATGADHTRVVTAQSSSDLTPVLTSSNPAVCSVAGDTVTGESAGTCAIFIDQAGDANFNAAPRVTLNITVTP